MYCPSCGRQMIADGKRARCTNAQCPSLRWPAARNHGARAHPLIQEPELNLVELTAGIERDAGREFVGTVYAKEVRVIEGCRCQGVSVSTVAAGANKNEVRERTFEAARTRAELYRNRGYEVRMHKAAA